MNFTPSKKIWVFNHKPTFMQRVCDYVRTGHIHFISGKTDVATMFDTYDRLVSNIPVFDDRLKASRARKEGYATARVLMYLDPKKDKVHWFVLIHAKPDQLPKNEKWKCAVKKNEAVTLTGYYLTRMTREGQKEPSWTWRYTSERYNELRDSIVSAIRSNRDQDLKILLVKVFGTMGFKGSREQAKGIIDLLKQEWAHHRKNDPMPALQPFIGWVRRKADKGVWLFRGKVRPPQRKLSNHVKPPDPLEGFPQITNEEMEQIALLMQENGH